MAYYQDVLFDETDLTALQDVYITKVDTDQTPSVLLSKHKKARQDGVSIFNQELGEKKIYIEGHISTSTREAFRLRRSNLMKNIRKLEKVLRVPGESMPVEYTVSFSNVIWQNTSGGYGLFSIEFITSDPYGYELNTIMLLDAEENTAINNSLTLAEEIRGYEPSPGYIKVHFDSLTDPTNKYVKISNEAGDYIQITRDWAEDEVLEIDMKLMEVKINGVLTDYSGHFWDFQLEEEFLTYEDDFTARTVYVTASYRPRTT